VVLFREKYRGEPPRYERKKLKANVFVVRVAETQAEARVALQRKGHADAPFKGAPRATVPNDSFQPGMGVARSAARAHPRLSLIVRAAVLEERPAGHPPWKYAADPAGPPERKWGETGQLTAAEQTAVDGLRAMLVDGAPDEQTLLRFCRARPATLPQPPPAMGARGAALKATGAGPGPRLRDPQCPPAMAIIFQGARHGPSLPPPPPTAPSLTVAP
jgi:hypothetical protein